VVPATASRGVPKVADSEVPARLVILIAHLIGLSSPPNTLVSRGSRAPSLADKLKAGARM